MPPAILFRLVGRAFARVAARRLRGKPRHPDWPLRFEVVVETMLQMSLHSAELSPAAARAFQQRLAQPLKLPVARERARLAGVDVEWFTPRAVDPPGLIVYAHGGGYVTGSSDTHAELIARLALAARRPVLAVNYRLCPEHRVADARDDMLAVLAALRAQGRGPLVLAGDSAGGNLVLITLFALRDARTPGEEAPRAAALIAPWADLATTSASLTENERWDWSTAELLREQARVVTRGEPIEGPLYRPLHADLSGLPPLLIHVGEAEMIRDDGVALARRVEEQGGEVQLVQWPAMIHAFHLFAGMLPLAQRAIDELAAFLCAHL